MEENSGKRGTFKPVSPVDRKLLVNRNSAASSIICTDDEEKRVERYGETLMKQG